MVGGDCHKGGWVGVGRLGGWVGVGRLGGRVGSVSRVEGWGRL